MFFRLRDIFLSLVLLALLSWLFILIMIALLLTQGKIFYVQPRSGINMKSFRLIKFSTLRDAAPGHAEADAQRERLTPVGKWLRRFSLDELPQLFNILAGSMSLVGPRPLIEDYLPLYSEEEKKRFTVKPGLTGWAQINGRNSLTWKQRFALDVWYVAHRSFWLDCKVLLLTPMRIFRRDVYADGSTTMSAYNGGN